MNWTCEQTELHLTDYLDGLMPADEQRAFDLHVNGCERCTPLVSSVNHAVANLRALPDLETPPRLVYKILDATLGPRETVTGWAAVRAWLHSFASPRFAYGSVSLVATFLMVVTLSGSINWKKPKLADLAPDNVYRNADRKVQQAYAQSVKYVSDLRVVYEIQTRLRQDNQLPSSKESTVPESTPQKQPGSSDGTAPASPRQQNRARVPGGVLTTPGHRNDVSSQFQVLAEELPVLSGRLSLVASGKLALVMNSKLSF